MKWEVRYYVTMRACKRKAVVECVTEEAHMYTDKILYKYKTTGEDRINILWERYFFRARWPDKAAAEHGLTLLHVTLYTNPFFKTYLPSIVFSSSYKFLLLNHLRFFF